MPSSWPAPLYDSFSPLHSLPTHAPIFCYWHISRLITPNNLQSFSCVSHSTAYCVAAEWRCLDCTDRGHCLTFSPETRELAASAKGAADRAQGPRPRQEAWWPSSDSCWLSSSTTTLKAAGAGWSWYAVWSYRFSPTGSISAPACSSARPSTSSARKSLCKQVSPHMSYLSFNVQS